MKRQSVLGMLSVVGLSVVVAACASKNTASTSTDDTAAPGEDVSQTESDTEALATLHVGTSGSSLAPATFGGGGDIHVQGAVGAALGAELQPAGCVTETAGVGTVTYVYAGCSGPWGLVHLTGTVTVAYSSTGPDDLTLKFSASNFQINGATLSTWTAEADITASGAQRTMVWTASLAGTTKSGRDFTRTNDKTITWNVGGATTCVGINGTSDGTISGDDLKTTVVSYQRCTGACPQAGSEITIQNETNGKEVDVKYDGGDLATVTLTEGGKTGSIDLILACGL
jgi:hypothetical protein